ncbi:MAG: hypothetical protein SXG53_07775 [Pseudomonadota bacterium]|nr:hypothetical protein [Pseudomonadota bacterium]
MFQRISLAILSASALLMSAGSATAAEPAVPKDESAQRACDTSQGATKQECKKVAAKIDAHTANPSAHPDADNPGATSQDIHHSSPAVRTAEEKRQDRESARKAEKQNQEKAATPPAPPK